MADVTVTPEGRDEAMRIVNLKAGEYATRRQLLAACRNLARDLVNMSEQVTNSMAAIDAIAREREEAGRLLIASKDVEAFAQIRALAGTYLG